MRGFIKKMFLIGMIFVIVLTGGCGKQENDISEQSGSIITFNEKFVKISGMTEEELESNLEDNDPDNYGDSFINSDGTVSIEVTEEQREYWLTSREDLLQQLKEKFEKLGDNYSVAYNSDYTEIDFYFSKDLSVDAAVNYIMNAEIYCAMHQLFSDGANDEWKVSVNVYNSETGKLVTSGDSETGLSWKAEDWEE